MKKNLDGRRLGLILSILIPFIALGVQWVIWPYITPFVWFLFFPAVFFSARLGGLKGGLASTLISTVIVWYFFISPQLSWEVANPSNLYSVGLFLIMGYLFSDSQEHLNAANRRTKATLRETEDQNRTTLYSIGDCVITTDSGGQILQMNPAAEKLTGWSEAEAKGKTIGDVFHIVNEATRLEGENPVERVLREGKVVGLANHTLLIARDGREYPIADSGAPIRHPRGEISGVVLVFRDQSAERAAQNALRESERKFRETISSLDEGFYWTTMDGVMLEHNPAFNRIFGFEVTQDLRGTKPPDFWQNPEDRNAYMAQLMGEGVIRNYLIDAKKIDGTKIVVMTNANLVKNETGQPVRIEGVFTDITERKQAEETILASEARYRHTLDAMLEGCQILGFDWRYLYLNDVADVHNRRPKEELLGKRYMDMWPGIESTQVFAVIRRCLEERVVQSIENQFEFPDGSQGWFELRIYPVPEGIVILSIDITERKQAEEVLRQSENTVRAWLDAIQESAFLMDREGIILAANATVAQRLQRSIEELVGACIYDILPPQNAQTRRLHVAQVIELGQPVRFEDKRSGRIIDNLIYPIFDQSGQVKQMAVLGTDITERKQAESAMTKMRTLLNETQEISKIGGWEYDITAGRVFWTDEVYRLHGVSKEYDPGNPAEDTQFYAPEDQKTIDEAFQLAVEAGTHYDLELQLITAAGEKLWVRTMGRAEIKDGKVVRVSGNIMDITERKQAEEQIRRLNKELEATVEKRTAQLKETLELNQKMIEASSLGIFACQAEGPCIIANPAIARISGTTVEKMLQLNFRELQSWKKNGLFDMAETALATGEEQRAESYLTTAFGKNVWLNYYFTTFTSNGRLHFLMLVDDITERKRAEEALQQRTTQLEAANQELESFAYSVSHDLRAPLRALDGFSAVLLTSYSDKLDEQGRHYLDRIRNASQRMGQLIEDLLGLSRITRTTFNLQPVDLGALAHEIAAELQKRDPQRQAEFIIAPNMTAAADSHLLRILLQNLLENAWKFTGKRETTHIAVGCLTAADFRSQHAGLTSYLPEAMASNPESVIYFVRDNGVGFDMTYADKLFTPFQRLHSLQEFPGTGIGLAIVQRIVARHGGRAWAEAQVDQGATFYFAFGGI